MTGAACPVYEPKIKAVKRPYGRRGLALRSEEARFCGWCSGLLLLPDDFADE